MQGRSYWAHSANSAGDWHRLPDHLQSVGNMARGFAGQAPWCDEAGLAGMAHDIGKYGEDFQRRLRGEVSGLDPLVDGAWLEMFGSCFDVAARWIWRDRRIAVLPRLCLPVCAWRGTKRLVDGEGLT
jgi:hypothetical protein